MNHKDLENISYLSHQILTESAYEEHDVMNRWPYASPYLQEERAPGVKPYKAGPTQAEVREDAAKAAKPSREIIRRAKTEESFDIYDLVLAHLIDEGYAETQEAANAIMANMSEEWKQSIVEGVAARAAKVVDDQRQGYLGDADAINKLQDAASKSMGRLKKGSGPVVTPGLPRV